MIRPKTFGPERVVEDPRVKAALLRFIWEMHLFAFYGSIVSLIKQSQDHSDIFISKVFSLSYSQFHAVIIPSSHLTVVSFIAVFVHPAYESLWAWKKMHIKLHAITDQQIEVVLRD